MLDRMHQVKKGETIQQIAAMYGVTVEELRAANPDMSLKNDKPKKDTFVCIPGKKQTVETPIVKDEPEAATKKKDKTVAIGVILPLEEKNERSSKMLEFYRGFLMAADSAKRCGAKLEIHTWNIGNGENEADELISRNRTTLSKMDVIISGTNEAQTNPIAELCKENSCRFILPFVNKTNLNSANIYHVTADNTIPAKKAIAKYVAMYPHKNYIILHSDETDAKGEAMTKSLVEVLGKKGTIARTLDIGGDDFDFEAALNTFRENCIVPDNASIKTLNILLSKLNSFTQTYPDYKICLLGYPEWQTYTSTLLKDFYKYDTYSYCTYYLDPFSEKTENFQKSFANSFGRPLVTNYPSYGAMGFDLGWYFMGDNTNQEPLQHTFVFERADNSGDMNNVFTQFVHYMTNEKIELVK